MIERGWVYVTITASWDYRNGAKACIIWQHEKLYGFSAVRTSGWRLYSSARKRHLFLSEQLFHDIPYQRALSFFLCIWRHSFCNGWTSYVSAGRPARSASSDFRSPHDRNLKRPLPLFPYVYFRSRTPAVSHTAPITSCLSDREFFYVYSVPYDGAFTESAERHF